MSNYDYIDTNKYYFDESAADKICSFFENALYLDDDTPLQLMDWQRQILRDVHGWKEKKTDRRKYSRIYIEVPSGQGKSKFAAGWCLYCLLYDNEPSPEVYSLATSYDQSKIIYDDAVDYCELQPKIYEQLDIQKEGMYGKQQRCTFKPLKSNPRSAHGKRPHFLAVDELHAFAGSDSECFYALESKFTKRKQPIVAAFTTAGIARESICWRWHERANRVQREREQGRDTDPSFYSVIYGADPEDDPFSVETWRKANPGYGITVNERMLQTEADLAKNEPSELPKFKRQHLNIWTNASSAWLDRDTWDANAIDEPDLTGEPCYVGLDLSSTEDLTAAVFVFPPTNEREYYYLKPFFWVPRRNAEDKSEHDNVPYLAWKEEGYLQWSGENRINYDTVYQTVSEQSAIYDVQQVRYDRLHAQQMMRWLEDEGHTCVEVSQTFVKLSHPSKEFERLLSDGLIKHSNHPILNWCADNITIRYGPNECIRPEKESRTQRVDGIVAAIFGLSGALTHQSDENIPIEEMLA